MSAFKLRLTVTLGGPIPLLSLVTSKVAGTLFGHGHYALSALGAGIGVAVLAVSLSHPAWAVRDVTAGELVHVSAAGAGLGGVCWVMLVVVAAFSMVLNCHAFFSHRA